MPIRGNKIDYPAFAEEKNGLARDSVLGYISIDITLTMRHFFEIPHVNFFVKVSTISKNRAISHLFEVLLRQHICLAGTCEKYIPVTYYLLHFPHFVTVKMCFK